MSGQGYHFAVPRDVAAQLIEAHDINQIALTVGEWDTNSERVYGGHKDWDVLVRCLSDGTFNPRAGTYPLNACFLGGHLLVTEGSIVNVVLPEQVRDVSVAYRQLPQEWFRNRFGQLFAAGGDEPYPESAIAYFQDCFEELKRFYHWAASGDDLAVVFYTDDCLSYFWEPDL